MTYEKTIIFHGDSQRAMQVAVDFVMANGFKITSKTDSILNFASAATQYRKQNPLAAIANAQITASGHTISIRAETKGLRSMAVVVPALVLSLTFVAVMVAKSRHHGPGIVGPAVLFDVAFIVAFPLARIAARRRIKMALDTLLHNMAMIASGTTAGEVMRSDKAFWG